jgi:sulfonate transport system permease protein
VDPRVLPSPWSVVEAARSLIVDGRLQTNLEVSVLRAFEGLACGAIAGTVVALVAGLTRAGEYAFDGVVEIKRSLPAIALIPLLMLWLGIGEPMKITVIAIGVFAQVYLPVHAALRGIDAKYVELAETLSVGRLSFLRNVVLPGALPGLFMGLRLGVNAAWLGLIVVEQINATSGIGYMITLAGTYGQTDVVILGLVIYGLLGLLSDALVRFLQRRALSWQRTLAS